MLKQRIRDEMPLGELLTGLAEEAAELAQAALKYRRAVYKTNPTPVSENDAYDRLVEELADVCLYLDIIGVDTRKIVEIEMAKEKRWAERLGVNTDA